jgi:hypothetical protein
MSKRAIEINSDLTGRKIKGKGLLNVAPQVVAWFMCSLAPILTVRILDIMTVCWLQCRNISVVLGDSSCALWELLCLSVCLTESSFVLTKQDR